jgi:hypothetical protein
MFLLHTECSVRSTPDIHRQVDRGLSYLGHFLSPDKRGPGQPAYVYPECSVRSTPYGVRTCGVHCIQVPEMTGILYTMYSACSYSIRSAPYGALRIYIGRLHITLESGPDKRGPGQPAYVYPECSVRSTPYGVRTVRSTPDIHRQVDRGLSYLGHFLR